MAGKKKKGTSRAIDETVLDILAGTTTKQVDMYESCRDANLRFGANINIARAFASPYDGLKLVERRILYCVEKDIHESGLTKVSNIVGRTLAKYHPHGDASVTEVVVKLANEWSTPYPLMKKHGSFGSKVMEGHAAMRYINGNISDFAKDCYFSEWSGNITSMTDNYLGNAKEPEILPCKYPMILINGITGIGYTINNNIPVFNFIEVCESAIKLIKDKNAKIKLIPDSPNVNDVILLNDKNGKPYLNKINTYGVGSYKLRSHIDVIEEKGSKILCIKDVPYQKYLINIKEQISEAVKAGKINGIKYVDDNTEEDEIDLSITIKDGFDEHDVINKLYMFTGLEDTYSVNMVVQMGLANKILTPKECILVWLDGRRETKRRLLNYQIKKLKKEEHILETLIYVIETFDLDKLFTLLKKSNSREHVIENLIKELILTHIQAEAIADLRIYEFSKTRLELHKRNLIEVKADIVEITKVIKNKKFIDDIIISELQEGIKKWGKPRKTTIINSEDNAQYISNMDVKILISKQGMVKKLPADTKGIGKLKKSDSPMELLFINNRENFIIFTDIGKMFKIETNRIPITDITSTGYRLDQYIKIEGTPITIIPESLFLASKELPEGIIPYMVATTKNGLIKRTKLEDIVDCNSGVNIIKLNDGDNLTNIRIMDESFDVLLYTDKGKYLKFSLSDIPETNRISKGVKSIELEESDFVLGFEGIHSKSSDTLVIISKNGFMKKITNDLIDHKSRASKGSIMMTVEADDEIVNIVKLFSENKTVTLYCKNGKKVIDAKDIPSMSRISKGKKMLPSNDMILNIKVEDTTED